MGQEILVAPIVIDRLKEIKAASEQCLAILNENPNLKDVDPFDATHALETEVKAAAERLDAAVYILQEIAGGESDEFDDDLDQE